MGKRSQARGLWPKRHDAPRRREGPEGTTITCDSVRPHTVRRWVCAGCMRDGVQLIGCADGKQRCPACKAAFDAQPAPALVGAA